MKSSKLTILAFGFALLLFSAGRVQAQFMPVVYDNVYGKSFQMEAANADFQSGDVAIIGKSDNAIIFTWLDRNGESRFTKRFNRDEFSSVSRIVPISDEKVLILGERYAGDKESDKATGRAMIVTVKGAVERNLTVGDRGTIIKIGQVMANGNIILAGSTPSGSSKAGFICKVNAKDKVIYSFVSSTGESCDWFEVQGSRTEYLSAAFSFTTKQGSAVARLDENGKPFYMTAIADPTFKIEQMASSPAGDVYVSGHGERMGGTVIKIRPEGDVVYQRQIAPTTSKTRLNKLIVAPSGEVLVGGSDASNSFVALLRPDGTVLGNMIDKGRVSGATMNHASGESVVTLFDENTGRGKVVKLSKTGRKLYEKVAAGNYTSLRIDFNGDVLLASPATGRLTMLSNVGELLFDRHVVENTPQSFYGAYVPRNGAAYFIGGDSRIAKLAHGIYVNDIVVNKPVNGYTTATFNVTISGYSFSKDGSPVPATVKYATRPVTASAGVNFDPVAGTLSFVPSTDGSNRYMNKFSVEVPISANDMLEGERTFSLDLADVQQSYLIKGAGLATITDQPAIIKMIATSAGVEGSKDVDFELGIFKSNGVRLTNATKSDIVIDGNYGNGTVDPMDIDMARLPRLVIPAGKHSGLFNVETLDDTRFEAMKSVVVNFNQIFAMSDVDVNFGGGASLSCAGELHDQAAMVAIESLGDHTTLNNTMSGLFKISLLRAKDGVLLTNNSGSDIVLTTAINESGTAKQGVNFVFANAHDLRIWGDGNSSAVNLNGMILYTPDAGSKTVSVSLKDVKAGAGTPSLKIEPARNAAQFNIVKN